MPTYLVTLNASAGLYQAMIKDPEDREELTRQNVDRLDGKLLGYYYGNGNKVYMLAEFPDTATLYTVITAVFATGGALEMDVVELFTSREMAAVCKAIPEKFGDYSPKHAED